MAGGTKGLLRSLPSIGGLLEHEEVVDWLSGLPRPSVVAALQAAIDQTRQCILSGEITESVDVEDVLLQAESMLAEQMTPSLRQVINATGVILHTGLGRAPLCEAAIEAIAESASGYCNLEYDLATGKRGKRMTHVSELLRQVTGAEAAVVVNNNAAATLILLQTFACGREVIVSRGQLVEIGGSFRLPEILRASGAKLREVGTTNRTRIADYEQAINDETAALLRVHPSNYEVVGFTESTPIEAMAELAHRYDLVAIDDLGSGALFDLTEYGLPPEPNVRESLEAGADLVCFSGDKLLGGPQCGVIAGNEPLIEKISSNPLMRTYRVDKLSLLALEATLRHYLDPRDAIANIPSLSMLAASPDQLADRARKLCDVLHEALPEADLYVCSDVGFAGGGSLPGKELETVVVQWKPAGHSLETVAAVLREADVPVIVRIRNDAICFDLRTLREADFETLALSVSSALTDLIGSEEEDADGTSLPVL